MISGTGLISVLVWLVVTGLIFYLLWWLISYVGLPDPFNKIARVLLACAAVLVCINVLLTIAGHPLVNWGRE